MIVASLYLASLRTDSLVFDLFKMICFNAYCLNYKQDCEVYNDANFINETETLLVYI